MRIVWFTWKDRAHPQAGGAEVVNESLASRLARDGHEVIFIVSGVPGLSHHEKRDGFSIMRVGGRWSVYWRAWRYFRKNLHEWPELVIDEINTIPFFAKFYVKQHNMLFVHQLCREIWFYQMFFPLNIIGYLLEPLYLFLLRDRHVITISESTKADLMRFGFAARNIQVITEGIDLEPIESLTQVRKLPEKTILSFGAIRPMKRTMHIVEAFELLKRSIPNARLLVAGASDSAYGKKVLARIAQSPHRHDIEVLGAVSREKKIELMRSAHVLCAAAVKEGWGLTITEANSQGTPAVVYDADGLRDSVRNGTTGLIAKKNTPRALARELEHVLSDEALYTHLQTRAYEWSKEITFENSYQDLKRIILGLPLK